MPGWHGLARAQEYTMRFVCGCRRRWEDRNSGLTENERSDEFVRALAGLVCVGQIGAARAVVAPDVVSC
jgi:hypothetical protein